MLATTYNVLKECQCPLNDVTTLVIEDSAPSTGATADDADPLVIDWRAPAARAFYTATPVGPQGQARRRHIHTQGRQVVSFDDEPLDGSRASALVGESALLAALGERRTGQMSTAAPTFQREPDNVVRADSSGPLVVQGGPGTGKTVVALHRVASFLCTYPQLAAQGVLVIGPAPHFLDYIAQVLPALGEIAMVSATCDTLVPGLCVECLEPRETAEVKGRALWEPALSRAITAATSGRSYPAARSFQPSGSRSTHR